MRSFNQIMTVICCALLFLIGLVGFLVGLNVIWINTAWGTFTWGTSVFTQQIFFLILMLLPLLALEAYLICRERERTIYVESEQGMITISESAIVEFIKKVAREIQAVMDVSAKVRNSPNGAVVKIRVKVKAIERLPDIHKEVRSRVEEGLRNVLGIDQIADVRVLISDIKIESGKPAPPVDITTKDE